MFPKPWSKARGCEQKHEAGEISWYRHEGLQKNGQKHEHKHSQDCSLTNRPADDIYNRSESVLARINSAV